MLTDMLTLKGEKNLMGSHAWMSNYCQLNEEELASPNNGSHKWLSNTKWSSLTPYTHKQEADTSVFISIAAYMCIYNSNTIGKRLSVRGKLKESEVGDLGEPGRKKREGLEVAKGCNYIFI